MSTLQQAAAYLRLTVCTKKKADILTAQHLERLFIMNMKNEEMIENLKCVIADISAQCKQLEAENAALRERLEKAVDKTIVSEMLAKYFDCPCNFSPLDEEMWAYCRDNCVDDDIECWIRVINKKCAELKGEKE